MRFRLFGVPVTIRAFFWLTAALLGLRDAHRIGFWAVPLFAAVMVVAVLVHEMGHAVAFMRHGMAPSITLHAMGGVTAPARDRDLGRLDRALISLAGPIAGLLLGGLAYLGSLTLPAELPLPAVIAVNYLIGINVAWSIFNLVPVLPFDGGYVMQEILGPRRARAAAGTSLVLAVLFAAFFAWQNEPLVALIFVMSAIQSYQLYTLPAGAVLVNPLTAPVEGGGAGRPGVLRRWWLQRKLSRLQAQASSMKDGDRARRRAGGPYFRVIQGGAERPKDKRYLN